MGEATVLKAGQKAAQNAAERSRNESQDISADALQPIENTGDSDSIRPLAKTCEMQGIPPRGVEPLFSDRESDVLGH